MEDWEEEGKEGKEGEEKEETFPQLCSQKHSHSRLTAIEVESFSAFCLTFFPLQIFKCLFMSPASKIFKGEENEPSFPQPC